MEIHTALEVKEDLVRGSQATESLTEKGIVRVFQVSGLSISFNPHSVVPRAMSAVGSNGFSIPAMGAAHPDANFSGAIVVQRYTEGDPTHDVINVFVVYRWRSFLGSFLKSCSGALNPVSRLHRRLGGGTQYSHLYTSGSGSTMTLGMSILYTPPGTTTTKQYPLFMEENVIEGMFAFKFLEQLDPEYFNKTYPGYCNSRVWRGYAPRTVEILPIQGSSMDNFWYENTYNFKYKSDTYDRYGFYVDPDTGIVPSDIAKDVRYTPNKDIIGGALSVTGQGMVDYGNGWGRFPPEKLIDFNLLFSSLPQASPATYGLDLDQFLGS